VVNELARARWQFVFRKHSNLWKISRLHRNLRCATTLWCRADVKFELKFTFQRTLSQKLYREYWSNAVLESTDTSYIAAVLTDNCQSTATVGSQFVNPFSSSSQILTSLIGRYPILVLSANSWSVWSFVVCTHCDNHQLLPKYQSTPLNTDSSRLHRQSGPAFHRQLRRLGSGLIGPECSFWYSRSPAPAKCLAGPFWDLWTSQWLVCYFASSYISATSVSNCYCRLPLLMSSEFICGVPQGSVLQLVQFIVYTEKPCFIDSDCGEATAEMEFCAF